MGIEQARKRIGKMLGHQYVTGKILGEVFDALAEPPATGLEGETPEEPLAFRVGDIVETTGGDVGKVVNVPGNLHLISQTGFCRYLLLN